MAYIDAAYYEDTFHGTPIPQEDIERLMEIASDLIDSIATVPFTFTDLSEEEQGLCRKQPPTRRRCFSCRAVWTRS